ncbi:MAG: hypothetical protein J7K40_07355 [candidate division Zixibacteria bacterium]|nr:hypothetical protein [candidate division Zixibacteria bacterium]
MNPKMSKSNRRAAVIINYLCILLFLIFFSIIKYHGWSVPVIVGIVVSIAVVLISFFVLHIRTHLWKLVHSKIDHLDERQIQVTYESLRRSYSIFTIISLIILLFIALLDGEHSSMLILIFASLIYLAHTLPSSIIAWTEKEV